MEYRNVDNDSKAIYIKAATKILSTSGFGEVKDKDRQEEKGKEHYKPRKKVKDYFKTLSKATETSNERLEQQGIPFRFCVYEKDEKVFIDFTQLDKQGKVKTVETKDITNEDFNMWIDDIANIEGLVIDLKG